MRNYLRVRGEYSISDAELLERLELPPRARRVLDTTEIIPLVLGTTSACAENTPSSLPELKDIWNYLRVRGEYLRWWAFWLLLLELPPRARRIRQNGNRI